MRCGEVKSVACVCGFLIICVFQKEKNTERNLGKWQFGLYKTHTHTQKREREQNDLYIFPTSRIHHTRKYNDHLLGDKSNINRIIKRMKISCVARITHDVAHTRAKSSQFGTRWTFNIDYDFSCYEFYTHHMNAAYIGSNGIFPSQLISLSLLKLFQTNKYV